MSLLPAEMVRSKRLRSDSGPTIPDRQRPSSPISSDDQAEDDAYDALPPAPQPRRRGRKPGALSRAAREAQRKTNHSLIEKARRTKINDALATLRELVPPEYKRINDAPECSDDDDDDEPKKSKGKSKAGEKEFKLEILVRTVAYLQDLTKKVKQLEEDGCSNCKHLIRSSSSHDNRPSKRRRQDVESNQADEEQGARTDVAPHDDLPSRLPSISTWLPPSSERRSLLLAPQSPSTLPMSSKSASLQLPTPPTSVTFNPSSSIFGLPPVLTLPSPGTFLPSAGTKIQPCFSGFISRRTPNDTSSSSSSSSSPTYSPEDETAASLLLRISTSATPPQVPKQAPLSKEPHGEPSSREESVHALTPSHLLGLRK